MTLKRCMQCGELKPIKKIKRKNGSWLCTSCERIKRKEHREFLKRSILGIRKRSDLKKEKKKAEPKPIINKINKVKIKKSKNNYLTMQEKQILFRKLMNMGLDSNEAKQRIKQTTSYLNEYVESLREQQKSEEEISRLFKEAFAKLISQ